MGPIVSAQEEDTLMRHAIIAAALAALTLPACTQTSSEPATATSMTSNTPEATYLVKPGMSVPDGADMSRGDVARDGYGRPFTYEGLGQPLASFSGTLADGGNFSSGELAGKWTIIEIWGLWCHDSMKDAKYAAALSSALAQDPDVSFMSVHTPQNAEKADTAFAKHKSVAAYFETKGYSFPTVIDTDASLRSDLNIRWTPTYLLIAPDLTVQGFRTGLADAEGEPVKDFVRQISEIRGAWVAND